MKSFLCCALIVFLISSTSPNSAAEAVCRTTDIECPLLVMTVEKEVQDQTGQLQESAMWAVNYVPAALTAGGEWLLRWASGDAEACTNGSEACLQEPLPDAAVARIEYYGCDYCFILTVDPTWNCTPELFDSFATMECVPKAGNQATCQNALVIGYIQDADYRSQTASAVSCGAADIECVATKYSGTGFCNGERWATGEPPVFGCQLVIFNEDAVRRASSICYNTPY